MRPSPELDAMMRRYLAARAEANFARVSGMYSTSAHFTAIGTQLEDWIGSEAFLRIIQQDWESVDVANDEVRRLEAFENGETGWVAMEGERTTPTGHSFIYRLTVVFVMEAGLWRAIQSHYSVPEGAQTQASSELTRTLSELLDAVDDPVDGSAARTGTVVFTDVVGSTAMSAELGDAAWSSTIGAHFDRLADVVTENGGTVVKTLGDGGMYVFDAVASALGAVGAIRRLPDEMELRIGVHTGDLVAAGDDVLGATVAKAARITSAASGGQVLVSAATSEIAGSGEFEFGPPLTLTMKGLPGTHVVHELR